MRGGRTWASRAYLGQLMAAKARMALWTPPPNTAATARAKTSPGKAKNISAVRINRVSIVLPVLAQIMPTRLPKTVMKPTSSKVEKMLVLLPAMTRESISRP